MNCRYNIDGFVKELDVEMSSAADLFGEYLKEMKENITEAKTLLLSQNWYMLERVMHNMKGVSANLDIIDVFEAARDFDIRLKSNIIDEASQYMEKVEAVYRDAEIEIKRFFLEHGFKL